jgi:dephospho-CoA kinase
MLKIGVTGGIGAGKSLICRVFSVLGVPVYDADSRAGRIMNDDPSMHQRLMAAFGAGIFSEGRPDRKALAGLVFDDPNALQKLNEIVHPAVREDFISWLEGHNHFPYIIKEAAILFETGTYTELDSVILVTAPEELRLRRIMRRDGESEESIRKRMTSQWPDEKKAALAGQVLRNDDTVALIPAILRLHSDLSRGIWIKARS